MTLAEYVVAVTMRRDGTSRTFTLQLPCVDAEHANNAADMLGVAVNDGSGHVWKMSRADTVVEQLDEQYHPVPDRYVSCGLPDGHPLWDDYAVYATNRGGGWWTVDRLGRTVSVHGVETLRIRNDTPESNPDLFMDRDTALRVAAGHARAVRLRPGTADEVLAADVAEAAGGRP